MSRGSKNLFDLDPEWTGYHRARAVVIPGPYEGTITYGRGTARGPRAILEASQQVELYDMYLDRNVYEVGIHMMRPLQLTESPARAVAKVRTTIKEVVAARKLPVLIGGEHSLSVGAIEACMEKYSSLSVLQLDAHADLRDSYEGTKHSHACVMRRVADMGLKFVQVGIRSMSREEADWLKAKKRKVFSAESVRGKKSWIAQALSGLSYRVYLTLDLDVLDPAEMPGTGTPEPGGLSYTDVLNVCRTLAKSRRRVVGLDIMELAPIPGQHTSEFLAARLLYHLIGLFAAGGGRAGRNKR